MKTSRRPLRVLPIILSLVAAATLISGGVAALYVHEMAETLPSHDDLVHQLQPEHLPSNSTVLDADGKRLSRLGWPRRDFVPLSKMSPHIAKAFIAVEDRTFYDHPGIDGRGILRAIWHNLRQGTVVQGASTITQQLARSLFLNRERSLERKIKEMILAIRIESILSKDKILELYLNTIYLGDSCYGVATAAEHYFGRSPVKVTLGEAALLAGIAKAPAHFHPVEHPGAATARRNEVLALMEAQGKISQSARTQAEKEPLPKQLSATRRGLTHATLHLQRFLGQRFELNLAAAQGHTVKTTLRANVQAELRGMMERLRVDRNPTTGRFLTQSAGVVIDVASGVILAIQGGSSVSETQFDRVIMMRRRIGNLLLPFAVLAAFNEGFRSVQALPNTPPQLHHPMGAQATIDTHSIGMAIGFKPLARMAYRYGFGVERSRFHAKADWLSASPLEVAQAYRALIGGNNLQSHLIERIVAPSGRILYEAPAAVVTRQRQQKRWKVWKYIQRTLVESGIAIQSRNSFAIHTLTDGGHNLWMVSLEGPWLSVIWHGSEMGQKILAPEARRAALQQFQGFSTRLRYAVDSNIRPKS